MVGEGLSILPVFSFGRISRHSAVNLGEGVNQGRDRIVSFNRLTAISSLLPFFRSAGFVFFFNSKKYLHLRNSNPSFLVASCCCFKKYEQENQRFAEDSFHALLAVGKNDSENFVIAFTSTQSFKKLETKDRSDFFPRRKVDHRRNEIIQGMNTYVTENGKMARTRSTAAGNNEDNTNPFVPPSFSFPLSLPWKTVDDGEIVVCSVYTRKSGEYTAVHGGKTPI